MRRSRRIDFGKTSIRLEISLRCDSRSIVSLTPSLIDRLAASTNAPKTTPSVVSRVRSFLLPQRGDGQDQQVGQSQRPPPSEVECQEISRPSLSRITRSVHVPASSSSCVTRIRVAPVASDVVEDQAHDLLRGRAIKVTGGLVGQHDLWAIYKARATATR